jgi:ribosome-binding protein aMBF1 (putative translation factor)
MPKCVGMLGLNNVCPNNAKGKQVRLRQGDLELCDDCYKSHCVEKSTLQSTNNENNRNSSSFVSLKETDLSRLESIMLGVKDEMKDVLVAIKEVQEEQNGVIKLVQSLEEKKTHNR